MGTVTVERKLLIVLSKKKNSWVPSLGKYFVVGTRGGGLVRKPSRCR